MAVSSTTHADLPHDVVFRAVALWLFVSTAERTNPDRQVFAGVLDGAPQWGAFMDATAREVDASIDARSPMRLHGALSRYASLCAAGADVLDEMTT